MGFPLENRPAKQLQTRRRQRRSKLNPIADEPDARGAERDETGHDERAKLR